MDNLVTTLCIAHRHPQVLLGMKKRGFGAGRWNGFGGKVGPGESIEAAAKRELREEAGIEAGLIEKIGFLEFEFEGKPQIIETHLFKFDQFLGEPVEGEEMKPQWFHIDEIPFKDMWPDDIFWMPLFLKNQKFKAKFLFGESDVILEKKLVEVESLK